MSIAMAELNRTANQGLGVESSMEAATVKIKDSTMDDIASVPVRATSGKSKPKLMTNDDGIPIIDNLPKRDTNRRYKKNARRLAQRCFPMRTNADTNVNVPVGRQFARQPPRKRAVTRTFASMDRMPYGKVALLDLLGLRLLPPTLAPKSLSPYERTDLDKDKAGRTFGGSQFVAEENYLYSTNEPLGCPELQKKKRDDSLRELDIVLGRIAQANLDGIPLTSIKRGLDNDIAVQNLRLHQRTLSGDGFHEFNTLIKARYDVAFGKAKQYWRHPFKHDYHHQGDHSIKGDWEDNVNTYRSTRTEHNINSWSMSDDQDPSIVYSNKGVRILSPDNLDLPFDERMELDFPAAPPRDDQPGFALAEEAFQSITRRNNAAKKSYQDWKNYSLYQIGKLGEEYLDESGITICFNDRFSKLLFKLKEDPLEKTVNFFRSNPLITFHEKDFENIHRTLRARLAKERDTSGSSYSKYLEWKRDMALRKLRREISRKLGGKWYFFLQHIPPIRLKPQTTHCAHPYCIYHEYDMMPAGAYRLNFMHESSACDPEYWLEEVKENVGTPGRAEDGQMWFCLTCVQDLFNGIGLIKPAVTIPRNQPEKALWRLPNGEIEAEWSARMTRSARAVRSPNEQLIDISRVPESSESASNSINEAAAPKIPKAPTISSTPRKRTGDGQEKAYPQPPDTKPLLMARGLDEFATVLHTFIKPELRHTSNGFYTLNPDEYYAFMKWKHMCIRKLMWEIPSNRAFCLQIPRIESVYDFEDFFGKDILDELVIGTNLVLEPVDVDDISTLKVEKPLTKIPVRKDRGGGTRAPHPLSQVMNADDSSTWVLDETSKDGSVEKAGDDGTRVLHSLSDIMMLVNERVKKRAPMGHPYIPRKARDATDILDRHWPPPACKSQLQKEIKKRKQASLQSAIDRNYQIIYEYLEVLGIENRIQLPQKVEKYTDSSPPATDSDDESDSLEGLSGAPQLAASTDKPFGFTSENVDITW